MGCVRALYPNIDSMTVDDKLRFLLCPPSLDLAKCVSKFLGILSNMRKEIDMGFSSTDLNLYIKHAAT